MDATPATLTDGRSLPASHPTTRRGVSLSVPVLQARPGSPAARFAQALPNRHPATVFVAAALLGYVLLAALSVAVGLALTQVLLRVNGAAHADERFPAWLAGHRTVWLTDGSLIGSMGAGGVVIPIVVAVAVVVLACCRCWRIAAFVFTAIIVEVATYRVTTLLVHRDRPSVQRLESLPVDASYPSGHTAASIAVYCGLALLLTSRFRSTWFRVTCWSLVLLIPPFVAGARMYRGMHHPLDVLAGALIGVGALLVALFAARAAGFAARERKGTR